MASSTISFTRKVLFAFLVLMALIAFSEVGAGIFFHASPFCPFRREPADMPGVEKITFALNEHQTVFLFPKPPQVFRIMVFGESAANGSPFTGAGFPAWLELMANSTRPGRRVEALNFGVDGCNSTLIRDWYEQSLEFAPDLVILYIGNNEVSTFNPVNPADHRFFYRLFRFLRFHSRTYALAEGIIAMHRGRLMGLGFAALEDIPSVNAVFLPPSKRKRIDGVYQDNLRYLVKSAEARGIPVWILSPAANLREWPPLKSAHYRSLSPAATAEFQAAMAKAGEALHGNDISAAIIAGQAALALDPSYAETHYLAAKILEKQGEQDKARQHFQLAREWEDFSLRAPARFAGLTEKVAEETGAEFLDLDRLLNQASDAGIAGFDLFMDSVHFTLRGQYETARFLFEALTSKKQIPCGPEPPADFVRLRPRLPLGEDTVFSSYHYLGLFLGCFFSAPELLEQAIRDLETAKPGFPRDPVPALLQACLSVRLNDPKRLSKYLTDAYLVSPHSAQVAARRFFPGLLELYQNQAVISVDRNTKWAKIVDRVVTYRHLAHPPPLAPLEFGSIPLSKMTAALVWDESQKKFVDYTAALSRLRLQTKNPRPAPTGEINLLASASSLHFHEMSAEMKNGLFLHARTADSYLIISPFPADPLFLPLLRIRGKLSSSASAPNWMVIYWTGAGSQDFREEKKIIFSWPIDNRRREMEIPLGRIIPLLLDRPLSGLRIDFTAQPAEIRLEELRLTAGAKEN